MTARIFILGSFFASTTLFAQNNLNNTYVPVNTTNNANVVNTNQPVEQQVVLNEDNNPPQQQQVVVQNDKQVNNFHPFQGNKFVTNQSNNNANGPTGFTNNNGTNGTSNENPSNKENDVNKNKQKEPYCKECEEMKKLKKQQTQQYFSGHETGTANKHRWAKFCGRTNKKMQKWFAKDKKKRPNYSCFNW